MCRGPYERAREFFGRVNVKMAPSSDGIRTPRFWQTVLAESVGTLFLVMVGCGSFVDPSNPPPEDKQDAIVPPNALRVALSFGLTYGALVYALRYVSGGHLNPAVTVAMLASRKISLLRTALYLLGQIIGALVGAALLRGVTPTNLQGTLGATLPQHGITAEKAFMVEFLATFIFLFVVRATGDSVSGEDNPPAMRPFVMGLALVAVELYAVPISGGGINPARSLGPAAVMGRMEYHWVYWFGPILGGVLGAILYEYVFASNASLARVKACLTTNEPTINKPRNQTSSLKAPEEVALRANKTPSIDENEDIEIRIENNPNTQTITKDKSSVV